MSITETDCCTARLSSIHGRRRRRLCTVVLPVIVMVLALVSCRTGTRAPESASDAPHIADAPLVSPLESPPVSPLSASPVSAWPSGRVVYHWDESGLFQVYLVDNGQPPAVLTKSIGSFSDPDWSPSGTEIVYSGYTTDPSHIEIFILDVDSGQAHRVMEVQPEMNWRPAWSPDGTQLVFQSSRDANFEIYRVAADGTGLVNLTNHPASDMDPDWAPDGTKIVFVSTRDGGRHGLYTMAVDGSGVQKILDAGWHCSSPRWSPDGTTVAFSSDLNGDGTLDVYTVSVDSGYVQRVTGRAADDVMPSWVGNDRLLFAGLVDDAQWDLFIVGADGAGLVQLTHTPSSERYPQWVQP